MPVDPDKRKMREVKRAVKKRGNKHRRQELKKTLADNPDEAAHAEENLGRFRSDTLNGLDRDSTRRKKDDPTYEAPSRRAANTSTVVARHGRTGGSAAVPSHSATSVAAGSSVAPGTVFPACRSTVSPSAGSHASTGPAISTSNPSANVRVSRSRR